MQGEIFNLILGMVNNRQVAAVASNSPTVVPIVNRESFEDMLAEEMTFTPSHQPRHVKFADILQGRLSSSQTDFWEEATQNGHTGFLKGVGAEISKLKSGSIIAQKPSFHLETNNQLKAKYSHKL